MTREHFTNLLIGKEIGRIGQNSIVVRAVKDQKTFDELFGLVFHHEKPVVVRAIDAVEKATQKHPEYLQPHKQQLLCILKSGDHKELKWHIAQLLPRVELDKDELDYVWHMLTYWCLNRNESKTVRVNALQGLFDISQVHSRFEGEFRETLAAMEKELVPSIQARISKIRQKMA
jgi:hypothetical protein